MRKVEYGIFEGDECVARGSSDFLRMNFGLYVHQYVYSQKKFRNKYLVKKIGWFTDNIILSDRIEVRKEVQDLREHAVLMMKMHGNTYAKDPEQYRKVLEENGLYYTYRPCTDGVGYILERS